jgi:hypothetical protein
VLGETVPALAFDLAATAGALGAALNVALGLLAISGVADQVDGEAVGAPVQPDEAADGALDGAVGATGGVLED